MLEVNAYNTAEPTSWKEAWQTDPLGGLSEYWPDLIESFRSRAPLGQPAPGFSGELVGGGEFHLAALRGAKSVLIVFGSLACPPCVTNIRVNDPSLVSLYERFSADVEFCYVYTREAHPGRNIGPHKSLAEKRANATRLRDLEGITFPLVVDTLDGRIQQTYADPRFNNPVFLVNRNGLICYKSAWLDASELPQVLEDQVLWDRHCLTDRTIKKSYSERIRPLREPFDPTCNGRIKTLMETIGLGQHEMGPIPGIESEKAGEGQA